MGKYLDSLGLSHLIGLIKTALGDYLPTKSPTIEVDPDNYDLASLNFRDSTVFISMYDAEASGGFGSGKSLDIGVTQDSGASSPASVSLSATSSDWSTSSSIRLDSDGEISADGELDVSGQLKTHEAISMICDTVDSSASNNGLTSNVYRSFGFRDSAERYMGYIQLVAATSGYSQMEFSARKLVNGSNVDNAIRLRVAADGSRVVAVSAPEEWRAALGFNTWTTVSAANWITWSSGWSGTTVSVRYNAALGVVRVYAYIKTSAAQTAGNKTLGTVAAAYRPKVMTVSIPSITGNSNAAYIDTNGILRANVSALSANGTLYFCGDYFIGV